MNGMILPVSIDARMILAALAICGAGTLVASGIAIWAMGRKRSRRAMCCAFWAVSR
jgi:hypothetical protein